MQVIRDRLLINFKEVISILVKSIENAFSTKIILNIDIQYLYGIKARPSKSNKNILFFNNKR